MSSQQHKLVSTRTTSEEQAQANLQQYEEKKEQKRQQQQEKKMATNLSTQVLIRSVQALEKFTGAVDQDPTDWLQKVDDIFEAGKVEKSDRRRLVVTLFGTEVINWYRSENLSSEYDIFKQEFIKAFTSPGYRLKIYSKIINRRQRLDETAQSYSFDILALCSKLNPEMPESEKILHLLRGLKPTLLQRVMMYDPSTCEELLRYAKRAEVVEDITQPVTTAPTVQTSTTDDAIETTAALRHSTINTNYSSSPTPGYQNRSSNYQQPRSSSSFNNNNQFRSARQPRRTPSSKVICYNCNGFGHFSYQCPSNLNY